MRPVAFLLPLPAKSSLPGPQLPVYVFSAVACVSAIRSGIHLLAPDGGAGSIAGLDLSVTGADGIVFAFALWGGSQLTYSLVQLAVAFRYRSLIPAMYVLLIFETAVRVVAARMKPVTFSHTPPGAIGNYVVVPLAVLMLVIIWWPTRRAAQGSNRLP